MRSKDYETRVAYGPIILYLTVVETSGGYVFSHFFLIPLRGSSDNIITALLRPLAPSFFQFLSPLEKRKTLKLWAREYETLNQVSWHLYHRSSNKLR